MNADRKERARRILRVLLAIGMISIGVLHFVAPEGFVKIVPKALPAPHALVLISGAFEIAGGVGLLIERTRKLASWGLVALYVSVFPANINMAVNDIQPVGVHVPEALMWLRLPLQAGFIALAWWVGKR